MASPPRNVEVLPSLVPGIGVTPTSKPPSFSASNSAVEEVFGYGITPMLPLANGAVQVAPVSSLEPAPKPLVVLASSL